MRGDTVGLPHTVQSDRRYEYFDITLRDSTPGSTYATPGALPSQEKRYMSTGEILHRLYRDVETGLIVSNIRAFENWIRRVEENEPQAND